VVATTCGNHQNCILYRTGSAGAVVTFVTFIRQVATTRTMQRIKNSKTEYRVICITYEYFSLNRHLYQRQQVEFGTA